MVPAATHIDTPLGSKETPPRRDAESQNRCSVVGFTRHVNFAGPCIGSTERRTHVLYQHVRTDLTLIHTACEPDMHDETVCRLCRVREPGARFTKYLTTIF